MLKLLPCLRELSPLESASDVSQFSLYRFDPTTAAENRAINVYNFRYSSTGCTLQQGCLACKEYFDVTALSILLAGTLSCRILWIALAG
jgi:hypothetical protein